MIDQRREPRIAADWAARYRFGDDAEWRSCQVIDVSMDGAAVELDDIVADELLVGAIDLEVTSVCDTDEPIPVRGVIRHGARTPLGRVLVGMEFESLTLDQLQLFQLLASLRATV